MTMPILEISPKKQVGFSIVKTAYGYTLPEQTDKNQVHTENKISGKTLLKKIAEGNRESFKTFYQMYNGAIYAFIKKRSYNTHFIEEVMQDIFINVWKKASYFKEERGNVEQWLFTIARNRLYDYWRQLERMGQEINTEWEDIRDDSSFSSDSSLLVEKAMKQLSNDYQEIIELVYIKGHTNKECAEKLKQPLGTVKWKVQKALEIMRNYINQPNSAGEL